jgi:cobalt/nickel transport system permease protein
MRLAVAGRPQRTVAARGLLVGFLLLALLTAGALSLFASSDPDGLEWSIAKVSGQEEMAEREGLHAMLADFQRKIAFLPDYNLPESQASSENVPVGKSPSAWHAVDGGQSIAGVIGVLITLLLAGVIGKLLKLVARRT